MRRRAARHDVICRLRRQRQRCCRERCRSERRCRHLRHWPRFLPPTFHFLAMAHAHHFTTPPLRHFIMLFFSRFIAFRDGRGLYRYSVTADESQMMST